MSFQAMTWASDQKAGSSGAKLVLLMLANHANGHTGQCNPKIKYLASECEMSERSVRNHIDSLASMGLLIVESRFTDGQQVANQYWLNMAGIKVAEPVRSDDGITTSELLRNLHRGVQNLQGGGAESAVLGVQNLPTNNQEGKPGIEPTPAGVSTQDLNFLKTKIPIGPEALDWLRVRKAKRALLTQTAWDAMVREADKAGIAIAEAVSMCAARGWQAFRADWMRPEDVPGRKSGINLIGGV